MVTPVPAGSRDSEHATLPSLHFPTRVQTPASREAREDATRLVFSPDAASHRRAQRDLRAVCPETASNKAPCRPLPGSPRTNAPAANCDGAGAELQAAVLPGDGAPDQRPDSLDP